MPTFKEIFELQEPEKSIYLREITLQWDIEYWEQYVYSEENGKIEGSKPTDLLEYKSELNKAKQRLNKHRAKYSEYMI